MRTSPFTRGASWRRVVATVAVAAVPLGIVAAVGGAASAHEAPGSPVEVFVDSTASADLADAIQNGWWGHEGAAGGTGTGTSFLDLNGSDADLGTLFPDLSKIRVAFVATSSDGSAEHPAVTAGESVGSAFTWFMDAGLQTGLNGNNNANDSVNTVSTGAEFNAWDTAGQPVQGYDNNLVSHDVTAPGSPVSAAPKGKSILNRWAAGTNVSMVFYATTGAVDSHGQPIVAVGSDGHAITAYMPFTTVQKPGDSVRTSAGYDDTAFGATQQSTHTTLTASLPSPQPANTPVDLTATVAVDSGSDIPVGSVTFKDGSTTLGTGTVNASGVAHLNGQTLTVGSHSLTAVYNPTNTQSLAFSTSTSSALPFTINGIATTTSAAATPGADYTAPVSLTATVSPHPGVTGSVVWKEGSTVIGGPTAIDATSGLATDSHTFTVGGDHVITAVFTPDAGSSNYSGSTSSPITVTLANPSNVSVDQQGITTTVPAGSLVVSTPYTPANPLNITGTGPAGALALNTATDVPGAAALSGFFGTATFQHINVLDTRAGAQHWTLTAQAGALTSGSHEINGENLGLTNLLPETANVAPNRNNNAGLGTITATNNPVPVAPVSPTDTGSAGLGGVPHTVLEEDHGPADAWYSGTLTLFAPITSSNGLYTGTITFTAS